MSKVSKRDKSSERNTGFRVKSSTFELLMPFRVRNILMVASLYDSYAFQDFGGLTEMLFDQYTELNLTAFPRIERVSTLSEAIMKLKSEPFDMVISLLRITGSNILPFIESVRLTKPGLPVLLLATSAADLALLDPRVDHMARLNVDKRINWETKKDVWLWPFIWQGDVRLLAAMIKCVEDRVNIAHDINLVPEIRTILLVEDNVNFYSSYLPMLYTEIVRQQQAIMADGLTQMEKLMMRRARPKILIANSYEEAVNIYQNYKDNILCLISDIAFPKDGKHCETAGLDLCRLVRAEKPDIPVVVQSSEKEQGISIARSINAHFIHKQSSSLLLDFREFLFNYLGFGPFNFRLPNSNKIIATAHDLRSFLKVIDSEDFSDVSLIYHAGKNDFSLWLAARSEFELAADFRSKKLSEFASTKEVRRFIVDKINHRKQLVRRGEISVFSQSSYEPHKFSFTRMGNGSLGGKGRGLAFVSSVLDLYNIKEKFPNVDVIVPSVVVITTDIFDQFMEDSNLYGVALSKNISDTMILDSFLRDGKFNPQVLSDMKFFISKVNVPIAIRSSSLFEDTFRQPFAGVYKTFILSNSDPNPEVRLQELIDAVRSVFASNFFQEAKSYVESTSFRVEEMKMAVVIQELVGRTHGRYFYPDCAGVARTINFYPSEGEKSEDGMCLGVFGFGGPVVEGGPAVRFAPGSEEPHFPENKVYSKFKIESLPKTFYAVDLTKKSFVNGKGNQNLVELDISEAENQGTFESVASTFFPETKTFSHPKFATARERVSANSNNSQKKESRINTELIENDLHKVGFDSPLRINKSVKSPFDEYENSQTRKMEKKKVITLAGIINNKDIEIKKIIKEILRMGSESYSCPVEVEWALNISTNSEVPHELAILQVRPMQNWRGDIHIGLEILPSPEQAICSCSKALGNGHIENIRDIVFIPKFDPKHSHEMADEIGVLNTWLATSKRNYVLIGSGRFGTKDPQKGVPVSWQHISQAKCLVETEALGTGITPSEGTHFFQNITSFGIGYFTIFNGEQGHVDFSWLVQEESKISQNSPLNKDKPNGLKHVKVLSFDKPLEIVIDGLSGCGVIMKPGEDFSATIQANAFLDLDSTSIKAKI